jgi:hypothetical protein
MQTRAGKRAVADRQNPLGDCGILAAILSYVGPGQWWFLSTVSKLWREMYEAVPGGTREVQIVHSYFPQLVTCVPHMT